ncbi:MAG: AAA family ATPase [Kineosporiaceae bacterium]
MPESASRQRDVSDDAPPELRAPSDLASEQAAAQPASARRPFFAGLRERQAPAGAAPEAAEPPAGRQPAREPASTRQVEARQVEARQVEAQEPAAQEPAAEQPAAAAGSPGAAVAPDVAEPSAAAAPLTPRDVVQGWQASLAAGGTTDTLLVTGDAAAGWLDLTHAHPSGLAQLMAGRPTRLSSLVREPAAHAAARRRARQLRDAAEELVAERGIRAGYLAAGLATWLPGPLRVLDVEAGAGPVFAPVLLRGCTLRPVGPGHEDYDLDLDDDAMVNPQLLRRLAADHAVRPDGGALAGLAFGRDGFDPRRVFDALEELCADVPDFRVDPLLVVGTFTGGSRALLADLEDATEVLLRHDLVAPVLGRDPSADPAPSAGRDGVPDSGRDRDPAEELLVLDLDPAQHHAVDRALTGGHVALEGPPGSGLTHTLAATVAALAAQGRRVLVVTPRRATADAFLSRLEAAGLRDVVLDLHDGVGDRSRLQAGLWADLDAAGDGRGVAARTAPEGFTDTLHRTIRESRATLAAATSALHRKRRPWGVSAYEAMVELADLMARPSPPSTTVRLSPAVCERLVGERREAVRALMRDAERAGLLAPDGDRGPWTGATLLDAAEADAAWSAAQAALAALPRAHALMDAVSAAAGLDPAGTAAGWRPHLELLLGVRETLDRLTPTVFERTLAELIAVTGPGAAEDAEGSATSEAASAGSVADQAGYWTRRTLRKRAKELVRPGVYVKDVHPLLVAAQAQARTWTTLCPGGGRPCVPPGLGEAEAAVAPVLAALEVLDACFGEPVSTLPLPDLQARLSALAADPEGAREQPQRSDLARRIAAEGLAPLVDGLRAGGSVPGAHVDTDAELDLAWWASVLEAIVRSDLRLARHDGHELRRAAADLRLAECAHLRDGARRVLLAVAQESARAVAAHPQQARWLADEVQRAHRSQWPLDLFRRAPDVVAALRPVWLMSPDAVARLLPPASVDPPARCVPSSTRSSSTTPGRCLCPRSPPRSCAAASSSSRATAAACPPPRGRRRCSTPSPRRSPRCGWTATTAPATGACCSPCNTSTPRGGARCPAPA